MGSLLVVFARIGLLVVALWCFLLVFQKRWEGAREVNKSHLSSRWVLGTLVVLEKRTGKTSRIQLRLVVDSVGCMWGFC